MATGAVDYSFGTWIKRRRKALDLTQQELARRVGCSASLIFKIESDERTVSLQIAELLAEHLEIPSDQRGLFMRVARREKMVDHLQDLRLPATPPPLADSRVPSSSLPVPLTAMVGRGHELRAICQQMQDPACRLLTLVGPGGVGKTRLALEAAHQLHGSFNHGACFVSLAGTGSAEFIIPEIAATLGYSFSGTAEVKAELFSFLKRKRILLVLDNLEHLLSGIELLVELLESAPHVKVLATSREHLNLRAEWIFEVQGLPVSPQLNSGSLDSSGAEALFVQRARQARMSFTPSAGDLPEIARVCRLVEGLPLGIELGAAWIRTMSLKEIVREIEQGMHRLTATARDAPQRHRSMDAVFDHSWNLLSHEEQQVMGQLSVFRGGFTAEAASQVTGSTIRVLAGLVSKSLLIFHAETGRYDLHELLRQYAARKLKADPQAGMRAQQAHAAHYAAAMQRHWTDVRSARQVQAMSDIEPDIDNVRIAWQHNLAAGNSLELLKLIDGLWMVYDIRGWNREAIALFDEAASISKGRVEDHATRLLHGKALGFLAFCAGVFGEAQQGLAQAEAACALIRPLNEREALGYALFAAALNCVYLGRRDQLAEVARTMNGISREIGDRWMEGFSLHFLATVLAGEGRLNEAVEKCDHALRIFSHDIGECLGATWAGLVRGQLALNQGAYAVARPFLERSLEAARALNYLRTIQKCYGNLGDVAFHLGDIEDAKRHFHHSLEIAEESGQTQEILGALVDLARVKAAQGERDRAVELLAVVLRHPLSDLHLFLRGSSTVLKDAAEHLRTRLESELEQRAYAAAWEQGCMLTLETAVAGLVQEVTQ